MPCKSCRLERDAALSAALAPVSKQAVHSSTRTAACATWRVLAAIAPRGTIPGYEAAKGIT